MFLANAHDPEIPAYPAGSTMFIDGPRGAHVPLLGAPPLREPTTSRSPGTRTTGCPRSTSCFTSAFSSGFAHYALTGLREPDTFKDNGSSLGLRGADANAQRPRHRDPGQLFGLSRDLALPHAHLRAVPKSRSSSSSFTGGSEISFFLPLNFGRFRDLAPPRAYYRAPLRGSRMPSSPELFGQLFGSHRGQHDREHPVHRGLERTDLAVRCSQIAARGTAISTPPTPLTRRSWR